MDIKNNRVDVIVNSKCKRCFTMAAFKEELRKEIKHSKRVKFFGDSMGSSFARKIIDGTISNYDEIILHAKFCPLGTVKKALDKFDIQNIKNHSFIEEPSRTII